MAGGIDPKAKREEAARTPTFAEFIEQGYLPHVKGYKKSWNSDVSYLNNQILPVFGKKYLDEITKRDVIAFHHGLKAKGYKEGTCNRSLILLRYAFNLAMRWETPGIKVNQPKTLRCLTIMKVSEIAFCHRKKHSVYLWPFRASRAATKCCNTSYPC